jgi:hypothetical protein
VGARREERTVTGTIAVEYMVLNGLADVVVKGGRTDAVISCFADFVVYRRAIL